MDENGYIEAQWPSKRIAQGGLFHQPKVEYTPETQKMLKVLMDEAKLTLMQRKQMDWCLRSGKSLVDLSKEEERGRSAQNPVLIRPKTSRRRSYSVIKNSGDLEREIFRSTVRAADREVVKKHLQHIMEFGNEDVCPPTVKLKISKPAEKNELPTKIDMLHELLTQIQEREEWLREMEDLGEGVKHREVISDQIAERIRRIEALKILDIGEDDTDKNAENNRGEGDHESAKSSIKNQTNPLRRRDTKTPNDHGFISLGRISNHPNENVNDYDGRVNSNYTNKLRSATNSDRSKKSGTTSSKSKYSVKNVNKYKVENKIDEETRKEEIKMREVKIDSLKKKIDKMNKEDGLGDQHLIGFSLDGSPCTPLERCIKPKINSGRIQSKTSIAKNEKNK